MMIAYDDGRQHGTFPHPLSTHYQINYMRWMFVSITRGWVTLGTKLLNVYPMRWWWFTADVINSREFNTIWALPVVMMAILSPRHIIIITHLTQRRRTKLPDNEGSGRLDTEDTAGNYGFYWNLSTRFITDEAKAQYWNGWCCWQCAGTATDKPA